MQQLKAINVKQNDERFTNADTGELIVEGPYYRGHHENSVLNNRAWFVNVYCRNEGIDPCGNGFGPPVNA